MPLPSNTSIKIACTDLSSEVRSGADFKHTDNVFTLFAALHGDGLFSSNGKQDIRSINGIVEAGTGLQVKVKDFLGSVDGKVVYLSGKHKLDSSFELVTIAGAFVGTTCYVIVKADKDISDGKTVHGKGVISIVSSNDIPSIEDSSITLAKITIPPATTQINSGMIDQSMKEFLPDVQQAFRSLQNQVTVAIDEALREVYGYLIVNHLTSTQVLNEIAQGNAAVRAELDSRVAALQAQVNNLTVSVDDIWVSLTQFQAYVNSVLATLETRTSVLEAAVAQLQNCCDENRALIDDLAARITLNESSVISQFAQVTLLQQLQDQEVTARVTGDNSINNSISAINAEIADIRSDLTTLISQGVGADANSMARIAVWLANLDFRVQASDLLALHSGNGFYVDVFNTLSGVDLTKSSGYYHKVTETAICVDNASTSTSVVEAEHPGNTKVGTWTEVLDAGHSGGKAISTNVAGDHVTIPFTGSSVSLVYPRRLDNAKVSVEIDSNPYPDVDLSGVTELQRKVVVASSLPNGAHSIKLIAKGTVSGSGVSVSDAVSSWDAVGVTGTNVPDDKDGNSGTMSGGVSILPGSTMIFDGINDDLRRETSVTGIGGSTTSSIRAKFNLTAFPATSFTTLYSLGDGSGFGIHRLWIFGDGSIRADFGNVSGTDFKIIVSSAGTILLGVDYDVVATYSAGTVKLIVNGIDKTSTSSTAGSNTGATWAGDVNLRIGSMYVSGNNRHFVNGSIKLVQVYNNVISPSDAAVLHGGGTIANVPASSWDTSAGNSTTVPDSAGSNTLTINGPVRNQASAFVFDGTGGTINIQNTANMKSITGFSVRAKLKIAPGSGHGFMAQKYSNSRSWDPMFIRINEDTIQGGLQNLLAPYQWYIWRKSATGMFQADTEYEIVVSWNRTGDIYSDGKIFVNGEELTGLEIYTSQYNSSYTPQYTNEGYWIGRGRVDDDAPFKGSVKLVEYFNYGLNASQAAALYYGTGPTIARKVYIDAIEASSGATSAIVMTNAITSLSPSNSVMVVKKDRTTGLFLGTVDYDIYDSTGTTKLVDAVPDTFVSLGGPQTSVRLKATLDNQAELDDIAVILK